MKAFPLRPSLLYGYLATEILAPFFASFFIMNAIFILVKIIPFLDTVLEMDIRPTDFIRFFSYLFPNIFLYTIPMSAMMGTIISFTRMSNDLEIVALKSCGVSIYGILPPVLAIAIILALLTSYFSTTLIPDGKNAMQRLMYQLAKEKIDRGVKDDQFAVTLGNLVVHVREVNENTGEWRKVWVLDTRDRKAPVVIMAGSGKLIAEADKMQVTLLLNDGSMHTSLEERSRIVIFDSYAVNIPVRPPQFKPYHDRPKRMNMQELAAFAEEHRGATLPQQREETCPPRFSCRRCVQYNRVQKRQGREGCRRPVCPVPTEVPAGGQEGRV